VDRVQIFIAKCAAGLLLLYAALLVPSLLACAWAARAGNLAMPFQGRMMLPLLSDVLNAGCYYFVGIVLTLRRARWLGSRLMPLGLALAASAAVVMFAATFWQAVVVMLIVQSIGAVAAWGVFATNGAADEGAPARFALGTMIWPGAWAVLMFISGLGEMFYSGGQWQYYQVDRDGNPVKATQTQQGSEWSWSFADMNGQPLAKYQNVDMNDPANKDLFVRFGSYVVNEVAAPWPLNTLYEGDGYRSARPGVVRLNNVAPPGVRLRQVAIYNVEDRLIDLYDPLTHARIGTVGPAGFATGESEPAARFPETPRNLSALNGSHVLAFDSAVYWIELDQRRVLEVFQGDENDPIYSAAEVGPPTDPIVVIGAHRQMHVLHPNGKPIFSTAMPVDLNRSFAEFAVLPTNHHVVLDTQPIPGRGEWHRDIIEYATDGTLVKRTELPRLPELRGPKLQETTMFGAIFPLGIRPFLPTWILDEVLDIRSERFPFVFEGFMIGSAILCAGITLLLAWRCGFSVAKTISWTIGNVLLGPAGVVVMVSVNQWPPREVCPACGGKRLSWRLECSQCGAALPQPQSDGREIFEPVDAFQPAM
jgi:hypothetical protein